MRFNNEGQIERTTVCHTCGAEIGFFKDRFHGCEHFPLTESEKEVNILETVKLINAINSTKVSL